MGEPFRILDDPLAELLAEVDSCESGDGDGSPVPPETLALARRVAADVVALSLATIPEVDPTPMGGIEFDWIGPDRARFALRISAGGIVSYAGDGPDGSVLVPAAAGPARDGLPPGAAEGLRRLFGENARIVR